MLHRAPAAAELDLLPALSSWSRYRPAKAGGPPLRRPSARPSLSKLGRAQPPERRITRVLDARVTVCGCSASRKLDHTGFSFLIWTLCVAVRRTPTENASHDEPGA